MKRPRQGRILRLKLGYNPNSSSIGTIVFGMPAALLGLTVAFGASAALLSAGLMHRPGRSSGHPAPPQPPEPDVPPPEDESTGGEPSAR